MPIMPIPSHTGLAVTDAADLAWLLAGQVRRVLCNRHTLMDHRADFPGRTLVPFVLIPLQGHHQHLPGDGPPRRLGSADALICPPGSVINIVHRHVVAYARITCDRDGLLFGRTTRLTPLGSPARLDDQRVEACWLVPELQGSEQLRLTELLDLGETDQPRATLLLRLLLLDLHRRCRTGAVGDTVQALRGWMRAHCHQAIGRHDAATFLGCSPGHVSRLLRRQGMGFNATLRELRLQRAEELLLGTDQGVAAVAAACGFPNADYFSTVFHRQRGRTPSAWRRQERLSRRMPGWRDEVHGR